MSKVLLYIAVSIDGYIARPDGAVDWLDMAAGDGEDLEMAAGDPEDYGYTPFYESIDSLIMGSKTYEEIMHVLSPDEWPYPGKRSYVLSRHALKSSNPEIVITAQSVTEALSALNAAGAQTIWLLGGGALVASMLAQELIDEIILTIIPVTLGEGLPLFPAQGQPEQKFKLLEAKGYPSGVVQIHYRRQHSPPFDDALKPREI